MSAPHSIGRHSAGVENVESIARGRPFEWATSASSSMSAIAPDGLPIVSVNSTFVFGWMAAAKPSTSVGSTNVVSMPKRPSVLENIVMVPP